MPMIMDHDLDDLFGEGLPSVEIPPALPKGRFSQRPEEFSPLFLVL